MSNEWIAGYYQPHIRQAQREIESKSDNQILKMNTKKVVASYLEKILLPPIEKRGRKRFESKRVKVRTVLRDNDDWDEPLKLEKRIDIEISYPIKHKDRIEEVIRDWRFSAIEFMRDLDYTKGAMVFRIWGGDDGHHPYRDERRVVKDVEEMIDNVNRDIKSGNEFARAKLTQFIEDFKTALQRERLRAKRIRKSKRQKPRKMDDEDNGDWDDNRDQGRTPNDDRSDALNPNNPAYDAARDNRADQLNPNNPRYQGR